MTELLTYRLSPLLEGEFILYRGVSHGLVPTLLVAAAGEHPSPASLKHLEHQYTLRADLDARQERLDQLQIQRDALAGELTRVRQLGVQREMDLALRALNDEPEGGQSDSAVTEGDEVGEDEEWQSIRLATRYVFKKDVEIQVNGVAGVLLDISVAGCQLMSLSALKPNVAVRVLLPSEQTPVACAGKIVWVRLEPPAKRGKPHRYRAGVSFTDADKTAIEAFAVRRGGTS